ncbi:hypothetical protein C8F04DRAFT_1364794 [Mycena alexandri]|uniref:Uncharacterized protein n=1 Tax=Mycena alexandri TaxID=1745969 RepID=A0AAD6WZH1_9AGAR|nr:hypothetical protein C8F04DRAFT_1364794 [Mycena alexandri]
MSDPTMCRGRDPSGDQCICLRADETYIEEGTSRVLCHSCGHIESAHPEVKPKLKSFIRSYQDAGKVSAASSGSLKASPEEAAAETSAGLRPKKKRPSETDIAPSAKKSKGKEKKEDKASDFKIGKAVLIVSGLNSGGELRNSKVPDKKEMTAMRGAGLVVLSTPQNPLILNSAWSAKKVNLKIKELFPKPMAFLERQPYPGKPTDSPDLKAQLFVGLTRQSKTLDVAGEDHPTGADLVDNCREAGRAAPDRILFLASKVKIPQKRWDWVDAAPAESDSEDLGSDLDAVLSEDIIMTPRKPAPKKIKIKTEPGLGNEDSDMRKAAKMRIQTRLSTGALEYLGVPVSSDPAEEPQAGPSKSRVVVISDDEDDAETPPPAESLSAIATAPSPLFVPPPPDSSSFFQVDDSTYHYSPSPPPVFTSYSTGSSAFIPPSTLSAPTASTVAGPSNTAFASASTSAPPYSAASALPPPNWHGPAVALPAAASSSAAPAAPRFGVMGKGRKNKDPWAKSS